MANLEFAMKLPEAWRLLRIAWRPSRMLGLALLSVAVCALIIFFAYTNAFVTHHDPAVMESWRTFERASFYRISFMGIMVYQCLLWLIALPVQVGSAANGEFVTGTWIFQQTAPQSARRLLLGKLLGGGGDIYTASATAAPFALIFMLLARLPLLNLAAGLALLFILSFTIASLMIFASVVSEKRHASMVHGIMIFLVLGILYTSSMLEFETGNSSIFSIVSLLHFAILPEAVRGSLMKTTEFFGMDMGTLALAAVFYSCIGLAFFLSAEAQALRLMSTPRSRGMLVPLFLTAAFFFIGFAWVTPSDVQAMAAKQSEWYTVSRQALDRFQISAVFFNIIMAALLYGVILLHARPMNDVRPWLYRRARRGFSAADLFDPGAPAAYTVVPLLGVAAACAGLLFWNHGILVRRFEAPPDSTGILLLYTMLPLAAVVLRDALFLQAARFHFKRGLAAAALIYFVGFCLTSLFINAGSSNLGGAVLIDLSPVTAIGAPGFATNAIADNVGFLWSGVAVNLILAALFGLYVRSALNREKAKLEKDLPPAPAQPQ
jgi:hypothetical protein